MTHPNFNAAGEDPDNPHFIMLEIEARLADGELARAQVTIRNTQRVARHGERAAIIKEMRTIAATISEFPVRGTGGKTGAKTLLAVAKGLEEGRKLP